VIEGKKSVWNLTKEQRYDLTVGDYLFTPPGDVHRVKYYDEDIETAKNAIHKELGLIN